MIVRQETIWIEVKLLIARVQIDLFKKSSNSHIGLHYFSLQIFRDLVLHLSIVFCPLEFMEPAFTPLIVDASADEIWAGRIFFLHFLMIL